MVMDVSSVHRICQHVISSSIQRGHISDNLCRISVVLKSSPLSDPPLSQISDFQGECLSLLGLQPREIEGKPVEDCINKKIVSSIEMNVRKPRRRREATPFLFEDDYFEEPNVLDEEYEEGEEDLGSLDL